MKWIILAFFIVSSPAFAKGGCGGHGSASGTSGSTGASAGQAGSASGAAAGTSSAGSGGPGHNQIVDGWGRPIVLSAVKKHIHIAKRHKQCRTN
jgi:hypothetical protein